MAGLFRRPRPTLEQQMHTMLLEMANKLETVRPGEPITTIGRYALLQATTMDPPLLRALRERVPDIDGEMIRRDYAAVLRDLAGPAATPPPVCCRRPMAREGTQWACLSCGAAYGQSARDH